MTFEIETLRLKLRAPLASDADFLFRDICCKRHVLEYVSWQPPVNIDATRSWLVERSRKMKDQQGFTWIATTSSHQPIGILELLTNNGNLELGFLFAESWWGQGYASEAVGGIVADANETIQAVCHRDNLASMRVLQKTGFQKVAVVTADERLGTRRDSFLFEFVPDPSAKRSS